MDELKVRSMFNDEVVPYWLAVLGAECCRARDQPPTPDAVEGLLSETLERALRRIPGFRGKQTRADQIAGPSSHPTPSYAPDAAPGTSSRGRVRQMTSGCAKRAIGAPRP